jgi:hypothetical protein
LFKQLVVSGKPPIVFKLLDSVAFEIAVKRARSLTTAWQFAITRQK